jgi:hypothetical protein
MKLGGTLIEILNDNVDQIVVNLCQGIHKSGLLLTMMTKV